MARARDPNRNKAFEIYKKHGGKIDLVEIASQLNISPGTIRGWKSKDSWDTQLNGTLRKNTERSKRRKGGQPGNKNAEGHGGNGPPGNKNAVKTGEFETLFFDTLNPEEKQLAAMVQPDKEQLLPELLEQTRHELGLDQPFLVQYGTWLKGVLTGDMGQSYSFKMPVVQKLVSCFWPTLKMSLLALLMMIVISIPLGILAAVYQNKFPDYFVRGITFIGVSVPSFWLGLILLSIFGVQLRWVNVAGGSTDLKAMILPSLTLALAMSAKYTRQVRSAVLEELHQDYVTGARMRGIKESVILWRHVLPNVMLPLVTLLGLSLGSLLGGTAVVEIIYNWPGMGNMAVKAISCRDYPLVQGYVLWIAILYMCINLLVDLSYTYLDPRLKEDR